MKGNLKKGETVEKRKKNWGNNVKKEGTGENIYKKEVKPVGKSGII